MKGLTIWWLFQVPVPKIAMRYVGSLLVKIFSGSVFSLVPVSKYFSKHPHIEISTGIHLPIPLQAPVQQGLWFKGLGDITKEEFH